MILFLQQYIYQLLNIDLITKKVKAIYYQVPDNSNFPYLYIGDFNSKYISSKDRIIAKISFKIVIYLRDKNLKSMLLLSQEIKKILKIDHQMIIRCIEDKITINNDGITKQINLTFKAILVEYQNVI